MLRTIENKEQAYALLKAGRLGNSLQTWTDLQSLSPVLLSNATRISIRYMDASHQDFKGHNIPISDLGVEVRRLMDKGALFHKLVFLETPPDDRVTLQAEVYFQNSLDPLGLSVYYSCQKNMRAREALAKDGTTLTGVNAWHLLRRCLWASDFDDLTILIEQYPGHVIELTSFEVAIGSLPRHNTVVWEVRYY